MKMLEYQGRNRGKISLLIALLLLLATFLVYRQVGGFDFVHFDDDVYVGANVHIQSGITQESVAWAFSSAYASFWHPLTWLSLMADYELYGLNPGGYHATNLILHILNTLLVFFVFTSMTASPWRSGFVAALFALHPLHVESVAWIAERKDVLSTFFWLLTMGAYIFYAGRPGIGRYGLVCLLFLMGLMAKPMLVTLPFCLLLLDFWPLNRIRSSFSPVESLEETSDARAPVFVRKSLFSLVLEKIPLLVLSLAAALLVVYTERIAGNLPDLEQFPLTVRIYHALVSYVLYLGKTFWPLKLAAFYPHPGLWPLHEVTAATALLAVLTFLALIRPFRFPYAAVGWLWYLGVMVPVIGFIQLGNQGMADRYTYVSLLGIFMIVAWGVPDLLAWRGLKPALILPAALIILLLGGLTWRQAGYWRDAETLFRHTISVTENNAMAYNNLGAALARQERFGEALDLYREALRLKPHYADALFNTGQALAARGELKEAEKSYREALQVEPDFVEAHNNLAILLIHEGKKEEATFHFTTALRIRPDYEAAERNLRLLLSNRKKLQNSGHSGPRSGIQE